MARARLFKRQTPEIQEESRAVVREIRGHVWCGAACLGVVCGVALMQDSALRSLLIAHPAFALAVAAGAVFWFAPLVACVAIGSVRRDAPRSFDDDSII